MTLDTATPRALPNVNAPPMPEIAPSGITIDGRPTTALHVDGRLGYPDVRSFRRKFGLLLPATNTSMEHELWTLLVRNASTPGLDGIGLHTTNVVTPVPRLATAEDLARYREQFVGGLAEAIRTAELAQPEFLILGMSLEHILSGLAPIRDAMADAQRHTALGWATWHDAAHAALGRYGARRIGVLTPFDATGNASAARLFEDLGYEVVSIVGFACAHALHIAHVPDWLKHQAILEHLARPEHRLDAVVQCGTNMSLCDVAERLEPVLGIPVLGINAVLLWHALRETGITAPLGGGGRLLREF